MTRAHLRLAAVEAHDSMPKYELRMRTYGAGDEELEVWQLPSPATPQLRWAVRIAGLRGRNLGLVEHRVLRRLAGADIRLAPLRSLGSVGDGPTAHGIDEHLALVLGLLFRALAPMRRRESMLRVAEGIEAMGQEEAAYWLGMAMHRVNPRRVLSALRMLLTDPAHRVDANR